MQTLCAKCNCTNSSIQIPHVQQTSRAQQTPRAQQTVHVQHAPHAPFPHNHGHPYWPGAAFVAGP